VSRSWYLDLLPQPRVKQFGGSGIYYALCAVYLPSVESMADIFHSQIPLANDFRPYFTIHDKDHAILVNKFPPKSGLVLGVTNPFFQKSCAHWPHVLSVGLKSRCV